MATSPMFHTSEDAPLSQLLASVRCFSFGNAQAFLNNYYLSHFPPDSPQGKNSGWNRLCNLATEYRLSNDESIADFKGRHRAMLPEQYIGAWLEPREVSHIDTSKLASAFLEDLNRLKSEQLSRSVFFAPRRYQELIEDAHSEVGRSEFINSQITLAGFYIRLCNSQDPRLQRLASSWRLLPFGTSYDQYRETYQGDAIIEDEHGELLVCSPTIHGWWETDTIEPFLSALLNRLSKHRILLLSPAGFRGWRLDGPVETPL